MEAMKTRERAQRILGMILVAVGCLGIGCETFIQNSLDTWQHDQDVDYYKSHGSTQRDADRRADEDQFFREMQRDP